MVRLWYNIHDNVVELVRWMHDVKGVRDAEVLIYAMEKPWKFTDNYNEMRHLIKKTEEEMESEEE